MWIETLIRAVLPLLPDNSFASNGECGLKLNIRRTRYTVTGNSFASNGECGLKHRMADGLAYDMDEFIRQQWRMWIETTAATAQARPPCSIHSPAMANVD